MSKDNSKAFEQERAQLHRELAELFAGVEKRPKKREGPATLAELERALFRSDEIGPGE